MPFWCDKEFLGSCQFSIIKLNDHMCFMDDSRMDTSKPVVKLLCSRVIKRTQGRDDFDRLRGRCARTNKLIEFFRGTLEVDMGEKIVFIKITGCHSMFGIRCIEKRFPFSNLFPCLFTWRSDLLLLLSCRTFCSLSQPSVNGFKLLSFECRETIGHTMICFFSKILIHLFLVFRTDERIVFRVILSYDLWIVSFVAEELHHNRVILIGAWIQVIC